MEKARSDNLRDTGVGGRGASFMQRRRSRGIAAAAAAAAVLACVNDLTILAS